MIFIYDNKGNFIESLNYEKNEFKTEWYSNWKESYLVSEQKFNNPIIEKGKIREKVRKELILVDNRLELLQEGEYVEAGEITVVGAPEGFIKRIWDKEAHIWKEGTTREELVEERKNKILKYSQLKKEKDELITSGFAIQEEIDSIDIQMEQYKKDIDKLEIKIKGL